MVDRVKALFIKYRSLRRRCVLYIHINLRSVCFLLESLGNTLGAPRAPNSKQTLFLCPLMSLKDLANEEMISQQLKDQVSIWDIKECLVCKSSFCAQASGPPVAWNESHLMLFLKTVYSLQLYTLWPVGPQSLFGCQPTLDWLLSKNVNSARIRCYNLNRLDDKVP